MVTMQDVARLAGVSAMTVSNVVNGRPSVGAELRERVERAVTESGYRLNVAARNLRAGRTGVLGFAVPELDRPYFGMMGALITREARLLGYRVVVEQTGAGADDELEAIELSRSLEYDGLILSSVGLDMESWLGSWESYPVVFLGERMTPAVVDHVVMPNAEGARSAVLHLAEQGARRIAFLGGSRMHETNMGTLRLDGFEAGLVEAGLRPDPALHLPLEVLTMAAARAVTLSALRGDLEPDAILAVTDTVAFGALRAAADLGLQVPADLLVAGFDDVPEAEFSVPSLTTVAPDHTWTARTAVRMLHDQIVSGATTGHAVVTPSALRVRESTRRR